MTRSGKEWHDTPVLPETDYVSSDIYTDMDLFKTEQEELKRKTWKFACHTSEIPTHGDFRTLDHSGVPIIVTRSDDGEIRAFGLSGKTLEFR